MNYLAFQIIEVASVAIVFKHNGGEFKQVWKLLNDVHARENSFVDQKINFFKQKLREYLSNESNAKKYVTVIGVCSILFHAFFLIFSDDLFGEKKTFLHIFVSILLIIGVIRVLLSNMNLFKKF